ncbi:peptide/nickel transport system ATP-binding protein [Microbacterium sp. AG1240]|uniref:ATP-binding cassette domain-containing protein n=1 Tax=Microbacterium sp. AG1240 TaxID=2183992 RepID=UPI000EADAE58|nr:ATP-binding cassette domain-containing protein [Microbacterium sp. AG1240]RKT36079.1 peptide/nickel transport system ATP-binding protein [Microbacterium sp. AG1240]
MSAEPLLSIANIAVDYPTKGFRKPPFRALENVTLDIHEGQTMGLVGESGSGKTTLGRAVLGLAPVTEGTISYRGRDITHLNRRERREISSEIQVVFQDPYTSLNPVMTVESILAEPLMVQGTPAAEARRRVAELLDQVGLPSDAGQRLPRDFSGGQRQRVAIARALALRPRLIVCDEPVSGLDLSTQSRVLELFIDIQQRTGVAYLFVTHDISVVRYISHEVAVMYRGGIVEQGEADAVTSSPTHPYTQQLMFAAPLADPAAQAERRAERRRLASLSRP